MASYSTKFRVFPDLKENEIRGGEDGKKMPQEGKIFANSENLKENNLYWSGSEFGFVKSVIHAYENHHSIVIRPDDIWIAILTQFSAYVNKNTEKYRKKFVNFEGKRDLEIEIDTCNGNDSMTSISWIIEKFTELIHENVVDPKLRDWILPAFSTTTENDKLVCGIQMMSTTKKYFNYRVLCICGIPFVTLEGTLEDWKSISEKIEKLGEFDLNNWVDLLKPVIGQFVNAKGGEVDEDFWKKICKCDYGNCGQIPSTISGWITAFCPFNDKGELNQYEKDGQIVKKIGPWLTIPDSRIPSGRSSAFVTFLDTITGSVSKTEFVSGHFGFDVLSDKKTLQPRAGWYAALLTTKRKSNGEIIKHSEGKHSKDEYSDDEENESENEQSSVSSEESSGSDYMSDDEY